MTDENENIIRIVLLGETGAGKTNLINAYFNFGFNTNSSSTVSAESCEELVEVNQKKYTICIWDTAGQEKYRSITKIFIKGAKIVIFVYDITEENSFKTLKYWVSSVEELLGKETIFGVVGNKIDLFMKQKVKTEEGKKYAEEIGALFCETSAKEDQAGFKTFVKQLVEKYLQEKFIMNDDLDINLNIVKKKRKKCC